MTTTKRVMNMLHYGRPGTGKTTTARLLCSVADLDVLEINGSLETGVDVVRTDIEGFCRTMSIYGCKGKACIFDECEYLSVNAQAGLRGVIEKYSDVTFILTANNIDKLHPALRSRCMPICFDPNPNEIDEIAERLVGRYKLKLADAGLSIPEASLRTIIQSEFPDFRRIANRVQFEAYAIAS